MTLIDHCAELEERRRELAAEAAQAPDPPD